MTATDIIQLASWIALTLNLLSLWYNYRVFRRRTTLNIAVCHGKEIKTRCEMVNGVPVIFADLVEEPDGPSKA